MNNELEIKRILRARGFKKFTIGDTWTRGSWTIRFYEDDIEIFDHPNKSRKYYLGNVDVLDIRPILDDIDNIDKLEIIK